MKALITIVSSLLVGLALASANFSPIHELQFVLGNKRRLLSAFVVAATGYIFLIAAVMISLVEGALQLDAQGFVMWSAVLSACVILASMGILGVIFARLMIPHAPIQHPSQSIFTELNKQFNLSESVERAIHHLIREYAAPEKTADMPPAPPEPEPVQREPRREGAGASQSLFRDVPAADVFQH